jgi:hypothetical protein
MSAQTTVYIINVPCTNNKDLLYCVGWLARKEQRVAQLGFSAHDVYFYSPLQGLTFLRSLYMIGSTSNTLLMGMIIGSSLSIWSVCASSSLPEAVRKRSRTCV